MPEDPVHAGDLFAEKRHGCPASAAAAPAVTALSDRGGVAHDQLSERGGQSLLVHAGQHRVLQHLTSRSLWGALGWGGGPGTEICDAGEATHDGSVMQIFCSPSNCHVGLMA
ncbi:hypothetical protein [Streptomyces collinus]|uniref:hypothetical protein n=1 Tax=Streptomyces collinus TaxID=42684 RepID=UPI002941DD4B|nr:hypothetical protein [Streptomyces collinus]